MSSNVSPERCSLSVDMRAADPQETAVLSQWVNDAAKGASLMTGCSLEIVPSPTPTACLHPNHALACAYKACMDLLGCSYIETDSRGYGWDMGSVGLFIPVIAPYHKIGPDTLVGHTEEFKECARSPVAFEALLTSAKCMVYTAVQTAHFARPFAPNLIPMPQKIREDNRLNRFSALFLFEILCFFCWSRGILC